MSDPVCREHVTLPQRKRYRETEIYENKKPKITYDVPHQSTEEGHVHVVLGLDIDDHNRFKIISYLGEGTFGKVVLAWDRVLKQFNAVKIVRNQEKYAQDASYEISYMKRLVRADPQDRYHLVRVHSSFRTRTGHVCVVMSRHGPNLLNMIQRHPLTLRQCGEVALQLFEHLHFLHAQLKVVHTDLKPENILMDRYEDKTTAQEAARQPQRSSSRGKGYRGGNFSLNALADDFFFVRICDFGGCQDNNKPEGRHSTIQTRHYRAPEVILETGWKCSADIWSAGCILYELVTGRLLYDTHENREHLAMMQAHLGYSSFPYALWEPLLRDSFYHWFTRKGKMIWPPPLDTHATVSQRREHERSLLRVERQKSLEKMLCSRVLHAESLLDLIHRCLVFEPSRRITATEALQHPFLQTAARRAESFKRNLKTKKESGVIESYLKPIALEGVTHLEKPKITAFQPEKNPSLVLSRLARTDHSLTEGSHSRDECQPKNYPSFTTGSGPTSYSDNVRPILTSATRAPFIFNASK